MRSEGTIDRTVGFGPEDWARPLAAETVKRLSAHAKLVALFVLAALTVSIFGLATTYSSNATQVQEMTNLAPQGAADTKTDRAPLSDECRTQAWGAWSESCAAALSGSGKVRTVSYITVNEAPATVNETILARYPAN